MLHTFVSNNSFTQLLDISSENFIFLYTFDSEFLYIEVWLIDQDIKPLEIVDKINIILVINLRAKFKKWFNIQFNLEIVYLEKTELLYFTKYMDENIDKNI